MNIAFFEQELRESNKQADTLAILGSATKIELRRTIPVGYLDKPCIKKEHEEIMKVGSPNNWRTPILRYLDTGELHGDRAKAKKVRLKVAKFVFIYKKLFKRSAMEPFLRCLDDVEGNYVL